MTKTKTNAPALKNESDLRNAVISIQNDLCDYFAGMDEVAAVAILGLVSGAHVCLLGLPGLAKTAIVERLVAAIGGASYFYRNVDDSTMPTQLMGPLDGRELVGPNASGREVHMTDGFFPSADIAMLDEAFKCNSMSLNSLLPVLNEGVFVNDGKKQQVKLATMFAASNEYPRKGLEAFWDRLPLRVWVTDPEGEDEFAKLWEVKDAGVAQRLTIDDVWRIRGFVSQVGIGGGRDQVAVATRGIIAELKQAGIRVSPRRLKIAQRILRGAAWLRGATEVDVDDLVVLKDILWDEHSQRGAVEAAISKHCSSDKAEVQKRYNAALLLLNSVAHTAPTKADELTEWRNKASRVCGELKIARERLAAFAGQTKSKAAAALAMECDAKVARQSEGLRAELRMATGL